MYYLTDKHIEEQSMILSSRNFPFSRRNRELQPDRTSVLQQRCKNRGNFLSFSGNGNGFYKRPTNEFGPEDGQTVGNILSRENHSYNGISTKLISCSFAFMNSN